MADPRENEHGDLKDHYMGLMEDLDPDADATELDAIIEDQEAIQAARAEQWEW